MLFIDSRGISPSTRSDFLMNPLTHFSPSCFHSNPSQAIKIQILIIRSLHPSFVSKSSLTFRGRAKPIIERILRIICAEWAELIIKSLNPIFENKNHGSQTTFLQFSQAYCSWGASLCTWMNIWLGWCFTVLSRSLSKVQEVCHPHHEEKKDLSSVQQDCEEGDLFWLTKVLGKANKICSIFCCGVFLQLILWENEQRPLLWRQPQSWTVLVMTFAIRIIIHPKIEQSSLLLRPAHTRSSASDYWKSFFGMHLSQEHDDSSSKSFFSIIVQQEMRGRILFFGLEMYISSGGLCGVSVGLQIFLLGIPIIRCASDLRGRISFLLASEAWREPPWSKSSIFTVLLRAITIYFKERLT